MAWKLPIRLAFLSSCVLSAFTYFACSNEESLSGPAKPPGTVLTVEPADGALDVTWTSKYAVGFDVQFAEASLPVPPATGAFGLNASVRNIRLEKLTNGVEYNVVIYTYCYGPKLCQTDTAKATPAAPLPRSIGGAVVGHTGPVVIALGDQTVTVEASEAKYAFAAQPGGAGYQVKVGSSPENQACIVAAAGTIAKLLADVTNADITCSSTSFTLGGKVTGLTGTGLVLQVNGGGDLPVAADGAFVFPARIPDGADYVVAVLTQPSGLICTVTKGAGKMSAAVTDVEVGCAAETFPVGGTVAGLAGSLGLTLNDGAPLVVTADGAYIFPVQLVAGAAYLVEVKTQPDGLACVVTNGSGTIDKSVAADVAVLCGPAGNAIAVSVAGLTGTLKLKINGEHELSIDQNGEIAFGAELPNGTSYTVTVSQQPAGQTCTLTNATGMVSDGSVAVGVTCANDGFSISGMLSGASGPVTLKLNGANDLVVPNNGAFAFPTTVAAAGTYVVSATAPAGQTCSVQNGSGTALADVSNVTVTCSAGFSLGGTVSGLTGTVKLRNYINLEIITITSNGPFTFNTRVVENDGYSYDVRVHLQPSGQTCTLANDVGVAAADVTDITLTCVP